MNELQPRVAVLDDDVNLTKLLRLLLQRDYRVMVPVDGNQLCQWVQDGVLDGIVLDIGLPDESGISIAQRIRVTSSIPIVFLSGDDSDETIVRGLNIGADDYVTKPFKAQVLLARVRSALRRGMEHDAPAPLSTMQLGQVLFEVLDQRLVRADGHAVRLTEMETLILSTLALAGRQTLSREEMFRRVYGREWDALNRGLEVHLSHLRKKLTEVSGVDNPIVGLRGVGYRLNLDALPSPQQAWTE